VALPGKFREVVRNASGNSRILLSLQGLAELDSENIIQSIVEIKELNPIPNFEFSTNLDRALDTEDGWFDGEGLATDSALKEWLEDNLVASFPERLPFPRIAPKPDGGVYMEWVDSPWRVSAEFFKGANICELMATNTKERRMEDLDLIMTNESSWKELYRFVAEFIPAPWGS
jgi:hypothetical protein